MMECGNDFHSRSGNAPATESAPVPEPGTILLMGIGLLRITGIIRKR
ncbi:MAG: PEP-CTERM sorting domain-containing protein [bacterium]|nr:PEP-CTERM sorting domain-containing protein [bacterium]